MCSGSCSFTSRLIKRAWMNCVCLCKQLITMQYEATDNDFLKTEGGNTFFKLGGTEIRLQSKPVHPLNPPKPPWLISAASPSTVKKCRRKPERPLPCWSATICAIALHNLFYCTRGEPRSVFNTIADSVNVFILFISLSRSLRVSGVRVAPVCFLRSGSVRHRDHFPTEALVTSKDPANSSC